MKNFEDGIKQERERVAALEEMRGLPAYQPAAIQELLSDCIRQGKTVAEATDLLMRELTKSTVIAETENPGDFTTGVNNTAVGEHDTSWTPVTEV
jgi:hypothetical protein